jgi:tetratricopeptide (TPR) repeat protein
MARKGWIVLLAAALLALGMPAFGQEAPPQVNIFRHPVGLSAEERTLINDLRVAAEGALNQGEYDSAIDAYNRILDIDPENADGLAGTATVLGYRGAALSEDGAYDAAEADFDAAIALYPAVVDVYPFLVQRGYLYWVRGDLDLALVDFEAAVALDGSALAHEYRAHANFDLGNNEAALADYEIALAGGLESALTRYNRGSILEQQGDLEAALPEFDRALELLPDWANAHLYRASIRARLGDVESATPDYWRWIQLIQTERVDEPTLAPDEPLTRELAEGRVYAFPFRGLPGQRVTITATAATEGLDPLIVILNRQGEPITASDDISDENFDSSIEDFQLPNGRDFTLIVSHAGGGSVGQVVIRLSLE